MTVIGSSRAAEWSVAGPKLATGSSAETVRVQLSPRVLLDLRLQMARAQLAPSLQLDPLLQPVQVCLAPICGRTLACS